MTEDVISTPDVLHEVPCADIDPHPLRIRAMHEKSLFVDIDKVGRCWIAFHPHACREEMQ